MLFTFFLLSLSAAAKVSPKLGKRDTCACGYQDSNGALWRESFESDFTADYDIALSNFNVQTWGSQHEDTTYYMQNDADNVYPFNDGLAMKTSGYSSGGTIYTSEIQSTQDNILYGSFRMRATIPDVPGVCFGLFTYQSDSQEADIEFLTSDPDYSRTVHYTNQPGLLNGDPDPDAAKVVVISGDNVDFTAFNEHRLDWLPDRTMFYFNSALTATISKNSPDQPSYLLANVWSDGGSGWTHGPPTSDAVATIYYINAYFNSSSVTPGDFDQVCTAAGNVAPCSV